MLIRAEDNQLQAVQIGKYQFQYPQGILIFADNFRKLTNRESEILQLLLLNRNNILERNVILKTLWQNDNYFSGRCFDVFVAKLRKYLNDDPTVFIMNIRGQGYKITLLAFPYSLLFCLTLCSEKNCFIAKSP